MADSFINKLDEASTVNPTDYTVFDVLNSNDGEFYTKKVALNTITKNLTGVIFGSLQTQIAGIQSTLNTASKELSNKLDKRGYAYDAPNNKMSGTLSVNASLSVTDTGHFLAGINLHNSKIINLTTPTTFYDGANKKYVDDKFSGLNIPSTANYVLKSGDTMGGALVLNYTPTLTAHAVNKEYVDKKFDSVKYVKVSGDTMIGNLVINSTPTSGSHAVNKDYVDKNLVTGSYVFLSGGTMTGVLCAYADPITDLEVATKRYVDTKLVGGNYLPLAGGTMTGALSVQFPTVYNHAATKGYVDSKGIDPTNYLPLSGGNMTGTLSAKYPTLPAHVATKKYVDDQKTFLNTNPFLPTNNGTMTGNLTLSGYNESITDFTIASPIFSLTLCASATPPTSNIVNINLNRNCNGIVFLPLANIDTIVREYTLFIKQGGSNAAFYDFTWTLLGTDGVTLTNKNIRWENGVAPTITKINGAIDIIKLTKYKNTVLGTVIGQNFS